MRHDAEHGYCMLVGGFRVTWDVYTVLNKGWQNMQLKELIREECFGGRFRVTGVRTTNIVSPHFHENTPQKPMSLTRYYRRKPNTSTFTVNIFKIFKQIQNFERNNLLNLLVALLHLLPKLFLLHCLAVCIWISCWCFIFVHLFCNIYFGTAWKKLYSLWNLFFSKAMWPTCWCFTRLACWRVLHLWMSSYLPLCWWLWIGWEARSSLSSWWNLESEGVTCLRA
jgi:hypothetical protein